MKKAFNIILKLLLTLILVMPILGATGVFPAPTAEMYQNPEAYAFIAILMSSKYIMILDAIVFALAIVCLWTKRVALAALLILPITVNIIGFHLFLDGGLLTPGAAMGNILLLLNLYFLWQSRKEYSSLMKGTKN
jgi:putative oxidoreductase